MKSKAYKIVVLFLAVGLVSGLVSILAASLSLVWARIGLGAILATGLFVSVTVARRLRWLSLDLSLPRCITATLITMAAHPVSVLVVITGVLAHESFYARAFPTEWRERVYSGAFPYTILPLYFAAVVAAVLLSLALKILTRKWKNQVMLLLIIAGILTIPLSQSIAALIGAPNWNLVLFPVGEGLFGALSGYWLLRASSDDDQEILSSVAVSEPHHRPAC